MLRSWAEESGYKLLHYERDDFASGTLRALGNQAIYRVIVVDDFGRKMSASVRCGGWWHGALSSSSNKVEAEWDE